MDEDLKRLIEETSAETHRRFDEAVGETRQHFDVVAAELRQENVETRLHFDVVAAGLRQENVETRQQLASMAESLRGVDDRIGETRQEMRVVTTDLRRHFDITVEDFRHQVQLVAEGVDSVINERVDGLISDIKNEFAETKAMMKFSFSDVDRRLRSLEERVERLESSRTQ